LKPIAFFLCSISAFAAEPTLTFSKAFPGSVPAYECVSVTRSGGLLYREAENDEQPLSAQLAESDTQTLFDMASKLNHFHDPIESGLKVANTGKKTFRYQDEHGSATEVVFNYSENPIAQQLLDRFEQIATSERAYLDLDRTARYDKLGVNDALAEIESLWLRKELAAPAQFVPLLNRIAHHEAYMHLARERAARLRDEFQPPVASATVEQPSAASQH
jgi:hypothetical protein